MEWLIVISMIVCWPIAGYLFWKWDLGGYRSERPMRPPDKAPGQGKYRK